MLPSSTNAINRTAAAQATCWSCWLGDSEFVKIANGIEAIGWLGSVTTAFAKID